MNIARFSSLFALALVAATSLTTAACSSDDGDDGDGKTAGTSSGGASSGNTRDDETGGETSSGNTPTPAPTGGGVGDQCKADSDCASKACLFAGNAQYGYCTKVCQSFSDCPSFWDCKEVGNGSSNYCVQKS